MLSAVVLTKNEEINIKKTLHALSFCDEVIVVDDNSSDRTVEISQRMKAKVFSRRLKGSFADQRNYGLKKAHGDWVFYVDADEWVNSSLKEEILDKIKNNKSVNGYFLKRKDSFLGKKLKHGETAKVRLLRLAEKDAGHWTGKVHETWQVKGKIAFLKNPLIHNRNLSIKEFLKRLNLYSTIRAKELYQQKVRTNLLLVILYPEAKFIQNYFLRLGFLDGFPGFVFSAMMSLHSFMVRSKLWVMQQNEGGDEFKVSWLKKDA